MNKKRTKLEDEKKYRIVFIVFVWSVVVVVVVVVAVKRGSYRRVYRYVRVLNRIGIAVTGCWLRRSVAAGRRVAVIRVRVRHIIYVGNIQVGVNGRCRRRRRTVVTPERSRFSKRISGRSLPRYSKFLVSFSSSDFSKRIEVKR